MTKIQKLAAFVRSHSVGCLIVHKRNTVGMVRPVLRIESHWIDIQDFSSRTSWVEVEPNVSAVKSHLGY